MLRRRQPAVTCPSFCGGSRPEGDRPAAFEATPQARHHQTAATMPHTSVLVATALLGVGVGPSSVRAAAAAGGPSAASGVVHMVFDDFRPDLPMYGQKFVHAPNLEAFANRSLVFDRAYVRSPHGPHPTRGHADVQQRCSQPDR